MRAWGSAALLGLLGYRSGRRTGAVGVAHMLGLLLATFATLLTGWLIIAVDAVVTARDGRIVAREPVLLPRGATEANAVARYLARADFYQDRQFMMLYLQPLKPHAVPPPGLPRWPEPGEAFVSPALLAADDDGVLRYRYGRFAGLIGLEGLADPNEWLVYTRSPSNDALARYDGRTLISGFGPRPATEDWYSTALTRRDPAELFWLLLFVVVLPTMVLAAVAVRSGSELRDRRVAMLDALGAPRRAIRWVVAGEAVVPVLSGAILGAAGALATTYIDVRLPIAGFEVLASDLAPRRALIGVLLVASVLLMVCLAAATHMRGRRLQGSTRPRTVITKLRAWPRVAFILAVAVGIWSATTAYNAGGVDLESDQTWIFVFAVLVALATMPSAVAGVVAPLGGLTASLGTRYGWPTALVAGRWLASRSAALSRMCAAFVVGLGVLVLVQVWVSQAALTGQTHPARVLIGDQLVTVRATQAGAAADTFNAALGARRVLRVEAAEDDRTIIVGTCDSLAAVAELRSCPTDPALASQVFGLLTAVGRALRSGQGSILIHDEL